MEIPVPRFTDIGYVTKSHIFGYPIITYDKGSGVVPRDCNTAISNIARQCGLAMDTSTPIYAQGFSNGGGNTWSWPKSSPDRVISYFVNKGQTASGILPDAALGIPGINVHGDQESPRQMTAQERLFTNNRATRGRGWRWSLRKGRITESTMEYVRLGDPYLWLLKDVRNAAGKLPLSPVAESSGWLADPDTRRHIHDEGLCLQ